MKNYKQICKEVAGDIQGMIEDAVTFHASSVTYEKSFGTATIYIETGYQSKDGWLLPFTTVIVTHDDGSHNSPRLTEAIEKALPDWTKIENNIELQMEYLQ